MWAQQKRAKWKQPTRTQRRVLPFLQCAETSLLVNKKVDHDDMKPWLSHYEISICVCVYILTLLKVLINSVFQGYHMIFCEAFFECEFLFVGFLGWYTFWSLLKTNFKKSSATFAKSGVLGENVPHSNQTSTSLTTFLKERKPWYVIHSDFISQVN